MKPAIRIVGDNPRVRATDPLTSHEAADGSNLAASQAAVLDALRDGPLADFQVLERAQAQGLLFTGQRLRTARSELVEQGRVEATGDTVLTPTGYKSKTWRLVPRADAASLLEAA